MVFHVFSLHRPTSDHMYHHIASHTQLQDILGHLGANLGPPWGDLGAILGHLGAILGRLGAILGHLGAILGHLGAIFGPISGLKTDLQPIYPII